MRVVLAFLIVAAASLIASPDADAQRRRGEVPVVHNIGMPEYIDMANEVTDQLLASPRFAHLAEQQTQARVVLGIPQNNSANWNLRVQDIFDTVRNRLANSGYVRVFGTGYTEAEYILSSEFTSTRTQGRNESTLTYTLTLTTLEGEYVGAWSAHRAYAS
jgi:hypothetical protein